MPAMEMAQDTAVLLRWLKAEGEFVCTGDPLMEIETDKVVVEIEASASGTLFDLRAQPGDEVPVGTTIALLLAEGESAPKAEEVRTAQEAPAAAQPGPIISMPSAAQLVPERQRGFESSLLVPASPKARRLAVELGLDLTAIVGSGPQGAVLTMDVESALAGRAQESSRVADDYNVVLIRGKRKTIAQKVQASYQSAPHIALTLSADMTESLRVCERLGPAIQAETGLTLTITTVVAKLIAVVLVGHPRLNAHLVDDEIREFSTVHLGIAVALRDGLIVPVILGAERKGLSLIQSELRDLTERAHAGKLKLHEVKGSTFTLSNLGMFGIEHFTAILNPPGVGILSVGVIREIPVGLDGRVVLRPIMQVTLNADHRAVDGALAAAFLQALKDALENPYRLLL